MSQQGSRQQLLCVGSRKEISTDCANNGSFISVLFVCIQHGPRFMQSVINQKRPILVYWHIGKNPISAQPYQTSPLLETGFHTSHSISSFHLHIKQKRPCNMQQGNVSNRRIGHCVFLSCLSGKQLVICSLHDVDLSISSSGRKLLNIGCLQIGSPGKGLAKSVRHSDKADLRILCTIQTSSP